MDTTMTAFNAGLEDEAEGGGAGCCCSSTPAFHDAAMMTMAALSSHVVKHDRFLEMLSGYALGGERA